jgi:hypothetical protein
VAGELPGALEDEPLLALLELGIEVEAGVKGGPLGDCCQGFDDRLLIL